jgi:hypothetical protein
LLTGDALGFNRRNRRSGDLFLEPIQIDSPPSRGLAQGTGSSCSSHTHLLAGVGNESPPDFIAHLNPDGMLTPIHILNVAISWGLLVLIWLVQLIIYPGLARIHRDDFVRYHAWYVSRITVVVLPLMTGEVIIAIAWFFLQDGLFYPLFTGGLVLLAWVSTFALQVPIHKRLQAGKDESRIRRLVVTNWIRTAAWSVKAVLVAVFAAGSL